MEDTLQVSNAPSRQKSCNACVKAKRRCDKRAPTCSRCAEKQFQCVYLKMPVVDSSPGISEDNVAGPHIPLSGNPGIWLLSDSVDLGFGDDGGTFDIEMSNVENLFSSTEKPIDAPADDMSLSPLQSQQAAEDQRPETSEKEVASKMKDVCVSICPPVTLPSSFLILILLSHSSGTFSAVASLRF